MLEPHLFARPSFSAFIVHVDGKARPVQDEQDRYHWVYTATKSAKTPKSLHKRFWAHEEQVPGIVASFQNNTPLEAANGLKWTDALKYWQDGHPQTSSGYIYRLELNIKLLCEFAKNKDLFIQDTSRGLFQRWLNERAQISPATANAAREIIAVAKYCHTRLDILPHAPDFLAIRKFKTNPVKRQALPLEMVGEYLAAAGEYYSLGLRLIIEFMIFTGVRSSEAAELTEDRIKPNELIVMQKAKGAGKREAVVPVDPYLQQIIDRARAWRKEYAAKLRTEIKAAKAQAEKLSNDRTRQRRAEVKVKKLEGALDKLKRCQTVFFKDSGTAWDKNSIRVRWEGCCKKAGLEYFVPHELRHTHATIAGDSNFNERYIQAAMRWDDPTMARRYVHETANMASEVAKAVRGKLAGALGQSCPGEPAKQEEIRYVRGLLKEIKIACECGKVIRLAPELPDRGK